jgi:uncharacterized protein (TIGR02646 family)
MIKLQRPPRPAYLTDIKSAELLERFISEGSVVWRHADITEPLLSSSYHKCAYCECSVSEESKYMEIDHFAHKSMYPEKVVAWDNLVPSCKRCNISKGVHNTIKFPIINPYCDDPKQHLSLKLYRFKGKTDLGSNSVSALDLNNSERLVSKRFAIGEAAHANIEVAQDRLQTYLNYPHPRSKNKLLSIVESILIECQPTAIYSAVTASVVFSNSEFSNILNQIKQLGIWQSYLEDLYQIALNANLELL